MALGMPKAYCHNWKCASSFLPLFSLFPDNAIDGSCNPLTQGAVLVCIVDAVHKSAVVISELHDVGIAADQRRLHCVPERASQYAIHRGLERYL